MTQISFTSGELYDIISALQLVEEGVYDDGDHQGAAYYQNMIQLKVLKVKSCHILF
jgi:hypothetical protein